MLRTVGKATSWGIIVLALLILANGFISYRNLRQLVTNLRQAEKSMEILLAVEHVLSSAKDVEAGPIAYSLTDNKASLEHYNVAQGAFEEEIDKLQLLTAGRPNMRRLVDTLERQLIEHRQMAEKTAENVSNLATPIPQTSAVEDGKRRMDSVRETARALSERGHSDLDHWSKLSEASYQTALVSVVNASTGALALLGAVYYLIVREGRHRAANEQTVRQLNRELEDRVHELETLLDIMPIGIAISHDATGERISANPTCATMLGIGKAENASLSAANGPSNFRMRRAGQDLRPEEQSMQRSMDRDEQIDGEELEVVRDDGALLKLLEYVSPLRDSHGKVRGCVGVFIDITERKRLEDELRAHADYLQSQQHWLQSLFNLLPVPLLFVEPGTAKTTFANRAALELAEGKLPVGTGSATEEEESYFTDTYGFRIPGDQMPNVRIARGERLDRFEMNWHLPACVRSLLINADTLPAMHGQPTIALLLFQDITGLKEVESELRKSNQAKDALLAMLGHELRNPLAAVTGALDVIASHGPEESLYITSFDILRRHIQHLSRLVDDMLDLTRLTTGRIRLRLEPVDLLEPLQHAIQAAEPLFVARKHRLSTEFPSQAVLLNADRARIEQVFSNLLINAAKYTEPGGEIKVSVQCQNHYALVSIKDNGMGIDPEVIPRLFDLFSQVNPGLDRSEAGLGIGLTVVRNLVELHGGDVEATSEGVGKGSEFMVRLPLGTAVPQKVSEKPEIAKMSSKQLRVMIVEDNEDIAYVMQALVAQCGHAARRAEDGPAALLLAKEWQPEVGLIDIGLPGMSGYEIACALRNDIETRSMFLVALTGFGQDEDRLRAQDAGFHRHVVKPISLDVLNALLREAADLSSSPR